VKTLALLALSALAPSVGHAAPAKIDFPAEAAKLLQTDKDFDQATIEKGADGWISFFDADGIMFSSPPGAVRGRAAVLEAMKKSFAAPGFKLSWTPTRAEVASDGQTGYSYGEYERRIDSPDGQPVTRGGTYVTIWKRQKDGTWKVLASFGTGAEIATARKPSS